MISKKLFEKIKEKHGDYASWAIWAHETDKPKSNMGDLNILNIDSNKNLLDSLNPNVIMVGLNFSRKIKIEKFANFHDRRSIAQDYKIRYAFKNTKFYGAYMTDIIKHYEELDSKKVLYYLKNNPDIEKNNIQLFQQEIKDLEVSKPLIIAFGKIVFTILNRHFKNIYKIIQIPHYSNYISKENYKDQINKLMKNE